MKKIIERALSLGIHADQNLHQQRMVRTTNLLNLFVIGFTACSFSTAIVLGGKYDLIPILILLLCSGFSFFLNSIGKNNASFLFFAFYINLAICYFNLSNPPGTDLYIFFFPVIVSLVLLNTAARSLFPILWSGLICAFFLTLSFTLEIPSIAIEMTDHQIHFLHTFNVIGATVITGVLSFFLTRIISRQFNEITVQNADLLRTKEQVNISLKEKEVLLAELHHRVKNNLAIISGLLNLQDDATTSAEAKDVIRDSKARIMSMALVHRMLYEKSELKSLDLCRYTTELVYELFNSYNLVDKVKLELDCQEITLPINKSVPLGLIINEIVTNSIKYAFKRNNRNSGRFTVEIKQQNNLVSMVVKDDGEGFPETLNFSSDNVSLGIFLIQSLCEQIEGGVSFDNDQGARIKLHFPLN